MLKSTMQLRLGLALVLLFCASWAQAAVPNTISYQGVLTDSAGTPINNAAQSMTFSLYDAATAGTALWSDTQTVNVQNGSYTVELGSVSNPLSASLFSGGSVWLEIAVGTGAPMSPRQKLNSVPYAFEAVNAQNAATATTVTGTASGDGSGLTNLDWGNLTNVPAGFADSTDNVVTSVDGLAGGTISGQVNVNTTGLNHAGSFSAAGASQAHGVEGFSTDNNSAHFEHIGLYGYGYWGKNAYGVYGSGGGGTTQSNGVFGYAYQGAGKDSGVRGLSNGNSGTNYGLYGEALSGPNGNYGVYATTIGTGTNDFAGYLEGDTAITGAVTVGTGAKSANSQFRVETTKSIAGYFLNNNLFIAGNSYGIYATNTASTTGGTARRTGTYASAANALWNYGVEGRASGGSYNYAIYGSASGGTRNIAGYFNGDESDGTTKAAVEILSPGQTMLIDGNEIDSDVTLHLNYNSAQDVDMANGGGNVGIGSIASAPYKLFVNGDIFAHAGTSVNGWTQASDRRFKTNIQTLPNALHNVSQLRGVSFDWRVDEFPDKGFSDEPQIGVIAQEVEAVVPELVHTDDQGYKAVAYDKISAVLIEAVKELKTRNETLQAQVDALRGLVCADHPEAGLCQ